MHIRHCPTHRVLLGGNYKTVFLVHTSMLALAGLAHSLTLKCSCKSTTGAAIISDSLLVIPRPLFHHTGRGSWGKASTGPRLPQSTSSSKTKTNKNKKQVNKPTDNGMDVQAQALPKQGPLCLPSTKQQEMRGLWTPRQECSPQQERRWRRRR